MQEKTPPPTDFDQIHRFKAPNTDNSAEKERKDWDERRKDQDGEHGMKLEGVFFKIAVKLIWLLFSLLAVLLLIWFFHLVAQKDCHWLGHTDFQALERILFASTLLSLAGKYFSKYKILDKH